MTDQSPSIEALRNETVANIPGINPDQAKNRLIELGYQPTMWEGIVNKEAGSHYIRALIKIAQGSEPRKLEDVYRELYPEHPAPGNWQTLKVVEPERKLNPLPLPRSANKTNKSPTG